jgi:uncharacterized FlgJ-related protein
VKVLTAKLRQLKNKQKRFLEKMNRLEENNKINRDYLNLINKVVEGANNCDENATFLMDLIKNYSKKIPRRSETSIRMCSV